MIFKNKKIDNKIINKIKKNFLENKTNPAYLKKKIIKKPWGFEYCFFSNRQIALWVLYLRRKQSTSLHAHIQKKTFLINTQIVNFSDLNKKYFINPFTILEIDKKTFHQTSNLSQKDIIIFEIETPNNKLDLLRYRDKYNRNKTKYEKNILNDKRTLEIKKKTNKRFLSLFNGSNEKNTKIIHKNDIVLLFAGDLKVEKKKISLYKPFRLKKDCILKRKIHYNKDTKFIRIINPNRLDLER